MGFNLFPDEVKPAVAEIDAALERISARGEKKDDYRRPKEKYAAKARQSQPPRPGAFSEVERAVLLRGVIDALAERCNPECRSGCGKNHRC